MEFGETTIKPITIEQAKEMIDWKYPSPYDLYNLDNNHETLTNLMDQNNHYYILSSNEDIIGFYCYGEDATVPSGYPYKAYADSGYVDIGCGMNPRYVSLGLGSWFLNLGMDFFIQLLKLKKFRLTVLENNIRGLKLYHKVGFRVRSTFPTHFSMNNFVVMVKE
jgi:RimJ/RimL family protein N-acetyltransferase